MPSHHLSRRIANRLLRYRGLSIGRSTIDDADPRSSLLVDAKIRSVVDVGANIGQYGRTVRSAGFDGPILSVEPQSEAFAQLSTAASLDAKWHVVRCALGSSDGEVDLNISGNSLSSSVLPMLEMHSSNAPTSVYVDTERVPLRRLDDVVKEQGIQGPLHLKLDVQGYELAVLSGALESTRLAGSMELEMSFVPLYEGQADFLSLLDRITALGFEFYDVVPGFRATNGRLLQIDGLFIRKQVAT